MFLQLLGGFLILLPFLVIFGFSWKIQGLKVTIGMFALAAITVLVILAGVVLLMGGKL